MPQGLSLRVLLPLLATATATSTGTATAAATTPTTTATTTTPPAAIAAAATTTTTAATTTATTTTTATPTVPTIPTAPTSPAAPTAPTPSLRTAPTTPATAAAAAIALPLLLRAVATSTALSLSLPLLLLFLLLLLLLQLLLLPLFQGKLQPWRNRLEGALPRLPVSCKQGKLAFRRARTVEQEALDTKGHWHTSSMMAENISPKSNARAAAEGSWIFSLCILLNLGARSRFLHPPPSCAVHSQHGSRKHRSGSLFATSTSVRVAFRGRVPSCLEACAVRSVVTCLLRVSTTV